MVFTKKLSLIFELSKPSVSLCLFCTYYFTECSVLLYKSYFSLVRWYYVQAFSVTEHRSKVSKCNVLCWVERHSNVVSRALSWGAGKLGSFPLLSLNFSVVLSSLQFFLVSLFSPHSFLVQSEA